MKFYKHLWSEKVSFSFSACNVPAVANMIVVSRSPMIPLTVLAALMHAWVPREPAWRAARTKDTLKINLKNENGKGYRWLQQQILIKIFIMVHFLCTHPFKEKQQQQRIYN